ncbi:MAG: oligosaccharide flippase family protein [Myxococcales bacterium]|nr:oligosaccharide flippase family protein [Myxococcota bacterium]MDW8281372.1 oligosaccharide flippase family protein [Myxococcales bacterium]
MAAAQAGQELGGQGGARESEPQDVVGKSAVGAATTAAVGLVARAAGLLTTVGVTYFVGKADYGHANLAMIVVGVLHTLTLLTPQQALLTRQEGFEEASALVRFYVAWSGVLVAVGLVLGGGSILAALGQPEATGLLYVYLVAMMLERLAVVPALRLNYALRFGELAALDLWANGAYVVVTLGGAALGLSAYCLPVGMVARHGVRLALLGLRYGATLWPGRPPWGPAEQQLARQLLAYALPVHMAGLGEFLTAYLDNVVAGRFYTAAGQGLYVVGYTLAITPADTIALYGATALVRALGVADAGTRRQTFLASLRYLCLVLFPMATGVALVAPTLERVLLPARWQGVAPIATALGAGALSVGIKRLCFVQLTALHRPRAAAVLDGLRLACFLLALLVVVSLDGERRHLPWIGWAVSTAFVLSAVVALSVSLRCDGLHLYDAVRALAPPLLGSAVAGLVLHLVQLGLQWQGLPPHAGRLLGELGAFAGAYLLYLRLAHGSVYRTAAAWIVAQIRRRS